MSYSRIAMKLAASAALATAIGAAGTRRRGPSGIGRSLDRREQPRESDAGNCFERLTGRGDGVGQAAS